MQLQKFLGPVAVLFGIVSAFAQPTKTWDAKALADWATPVAGLNVRPGHFSTRAGVSAAGARPLDSLSRSGSGASHTTKIIVKPCAGKLHARFERGLLKAGWLL